MTAISNLSSRPGSSPAVLSRAQMPQTDRRLGIALSSALFSVLALSMACNTYDPKLGSSPFRCGVDNPRCPDGYECVTFSAAEEICQRIGGDPAVRPDGGGDGGGGGGGTLNCNDDSVFEPNESITDPTFTSIPDSQMSARYVVAICPSTDQDFFKFDVAVRGANVSVEIEYQSGRGTLALDVVNSSGVSIGSGAPVAGNPNILRATIPNLPVGSYFAQVRAAADGVENNYSIAIVSQ